jgi:predicted enzyme related to lactoylglutathione lyase
MTGHVTFYVEAGRRPRGSAAVMGPDEVPGGPVIGQFKDPEGHTVGLVAAQ